MLGVCAYLQQRHGANSNALSSSSCPDPTAEHPGCKTRSFPGSLLFLGPRAGWLPAAHGLASGHHCHLLLHSMSSRTRSLAWSWILAGFSSRGSISSRQDFCSVRAPAREGEGLLAWRQCGGGRLRPQSPSANVLPRLSSPETDEGLDLGAAGPNVGISFLEQRKRRFRLCNLLFQGRFSSMQQQDGKEQFRVYQPHHRRCSTGEAMGRKGAEKGGKWTASPESSKIGNRQTANPQLLANLCSKAIEVCSESAGRCLSLEITEY